MAIKLKFFMRSALVMLLCGLFSLSIQAQKKNDNFQYNIRPATSAIKIDGLIDEKAWIDADEVTDFFMVLPMDTSRANIKTAVRMTYDDNNVYIVATNFNGENGKPVVESLRRDFGFQKNDNFIVFIEPFNDQTNGFAFGANAVGAQWDASLFDGGKADLSWDNKWTSEVKTYADRWVFEAAIPFKSIRFEEGVARWGINFSRNDLQSTEKSAWAPVPRQFPTSSFAYNGWLAWDKAPPSPTLNISAIPYISGGLTKNFANKKPTDYRGDFGGDAKIAVTSSLNLDVTINPDFSQVEVDRQVTNLDRFELFFPERRQFFLENGDLFANFGYSSIRPFFSRRIGLNVPIQVGARLSGKVDENWRVGLMNMQTGKTDADAALPSQNFTVLAAQRKVFARSNIGALLVNKTSLNYQTAVNGKYSKYNRNIGLEYNLASSNNFWTGKAFFLKSFTPNKSGKDLVHAANLQYNNKIWTLGWQHQYVGSNYNAEVGYVPRRGIINLNPQVGRLFFPKGGSVLTHSLSVFSNIYLNESFRKTDWVAYMPYNVIFRNRTSFTLWIAHDYVKLLNDFDPTNFKGDSLRQGTEHSWNAFGTEFISKPQSLFTYGFTTRYGGYYANGTRLAVTAELGYRFQPYVSLALSATYNDIRLPKPWEITQFWLVGPRVDVTMTNKLFLTTFVQYNQQQKNVNLNTRFQWRYKPASDLFIVYTDNYLPATFSANDRVSVKNRALVLKMTYWWNL
jgi:Domain of unknown function (DUF5916)/Carbohydrate family 9 binding domain-like